MFYFSLLFFFLKSSNTFGFVTRLYNIYYLLILFYFFVIFSSILFWIVISLGKQNKINDFFLKIKLQCWIILLSIHYIACVVSVFNSHSNTVEWLHRFKLFFAFFRWIYPKCANSLKNFFFMTTWRTKKKTLFIIVYVYLFVSDT